jgi:serine phosphatase RsbU (regulator of sigma subunit)
MLKPFFFLIAMAVISVAVAQNPTETFRLQFDSLKALPDNAEKAKALNDLAWQAKYYDLDLTEEITRVSLAIAVKNKLDSEAGMAYKIKGIVCDETGRYAEAIDNYHQAIKSYENINDTMGVAKCEANVGIIYAHTRKQAEAFPYFFSSLATFREKQFKIGEQTCYLQIGICHQDLDNLDSALYYFEAAKRVMESTGASDPNVYGNLGNLHNLMGQPEIAREYLEQAVNLFELHSPGNVSVKVWYQNLGSTYLDLGMNKEAVVVLQKSRDLTGDNKFNREFMYLLRALAEAHEKAGNYKDALQCYKDVLYIRDSVYSIDNLAQINDMKEKYDSEKKQLQIEALDKEKKIAEVETEREQAKVAYFTWGSVGLGVLLVLVISGFFMKSKDNRKIKQQNTEIESQRLVLEEKNHEILSSIEYARRIQTAILPPEKLIHAQLKDSFVLYKPKDIVAGDFYWMESYAKASESEGKEGVVLLAVADCTGHGVPGAMVSVVCHNALNRSVREFGLTDPGKILDKTTSLVVEQFSRSEENVKDGMDISLCSLSFSTRTLSWAGANNPLWIVRKGELIEVAPDKQPVGKHEYLKPFTTHAMKIESGDAVYLFSDGYADQFGGEAGKKFKSKSFKKLLLEIQHLSMADQQHKINAEFEQWRGTLEQVDDVCVIGVKI